MITPAEQFALDIAEHLHNNWSALERKAIFRSLSSSFCFTCGEILIGDSRDCPCLIDKRGEIEQQIDNLEMGNLP